MVWGTLNVKYTFTPPTSSPPPVYGGPGGGSGDSPPSAGGRLDTPAKSPTVPWPIGTAIPTTPSGYSPFDVDGDGVITFNDLVAQINKSPARDIDGDGDVDHDDLDMLIDFFGGIPGDFDHDGSVSINDFNIISANAGHTGVGPDDGDIDGDGGVSINDFNVFSMFFGIDPTY